LASWCHVVWLPVPNLQAFAHVIYYGNILNEFCRLISEERK